MWLYLLIIIFVIIWVWVYFRTPKGEEETEGYEWMGQHRHPKWLKKLKKKKETSREVG